LSVARPEQIRDLFAVVFGGDGEGSAFVRRRLRHPDAPHAARISDPGELPAFGRGDEGGGERGAQDLLDRERTRPGGGLVRGRGRAARREGEESDCQGGGEPRTKTEKVCLTDGVVRHGPPQGLASL